MSRSGADDGQSSLCGVGRLGAAVEQNADDDDRHILLTMFATASCVVEKLASS